MIVYFGGPEGGGKTALMTRYNRIHHLMGGECWAFPGYELLNNRGRTVSRLVMPEEIMSLLDDMQYVVLSIDEIQNFMHHHAWWDNLVDIVTYGAAAQRRKRQFNILASGPIFDWVPSDLRHMFHEVITCADRHWKNHSIPRGQQIEIVREDRRGVLSGRIGTRTRPQTFWPGPYFKYFDTFSLVDPRYQFHKVRMKRETVTIDGEGRIIQKVQGLSDPATLDKYIKEYGKDLDPVMENARQLLAKLKANNINIVDKEVIYSSLGIPRHIAGQYMKRLGAKYIDWKGKYDISDIVVGNKTAGKSVNT